VPVASWGISAARAGADTCGRRAEAHTIEEELSPLNPPINRRTAMLGYAMELVDNLGGKDNVPVDELPIVHKIGDLSACHRPQLAARRFFPVILTRSAGTVSDNVNAIRLDRCRSRFAVPF
jgi:hypothetical protein